MLNLLLLYIFREHTRFTFFPFFCSAGRGHAFPLCLWICLGDTDLPDASCPSRGILWTSAAGPAKPTTAAVTSYATGQGRDTPAAVLREGNAVAWK